MSHPTKVSTALILGAVIGALATIGVLVVLAKTIEIPAPVCPALFDGATPQQIMN